MNSKDDMNAPVTRGELKEEMALFEARFDDKLDKLDQKLDQKLAALEVRLEERLATRLRAELGAEIGAEIARQLKAMQEHFNALFGIVDEKYNDLPPRVTRLEDAVFAPKPARRRRSS